MASKLELIHEIQRIKKKKALERELRLRRGYDPEIWDEAPVSIDEFIESPEYIGKSTDYGKAIYPYWKEQFRHIFDPKNEIFQTIFSGSIGIGKSTIANIALTYIIYKLLCLKNPQKYYGLIEDTSIGIVFFNLVLDLADSVGFAQVNGTFLKSPFFLKHGTVEGTKNKTLKFKKKVELILASTGSQRFLGRNVFAGVLDEVSENKQDGRIYKNSKVSKILKIYTGVQRRMSSRFSQAGGKLPGMLFLVSSTQEEMAFLSQVIKEYRTDPHTHIVEPSQWEVKWYQKDPHGNRKYSGSMFPVAVGDARRDSVIIEASETEKYNDLGYKILQVPVELREEFERDIKNALRELAGISNESSGKLIPYPDKIENIFDYDLVVPTGSESFDVGLMQQNLPFSDFITPSGLVSLVEKRGRSMFIHVDTGLKEDALCFAACSTTSSKQVQRFSDAEETYKIEEPVYEIDLMLRVKAIPGDEISLDRVSEFIIWLRDYMGWDIAHVSFDQYQSAHLSQRIKKVDIDSKVLSLDRDDTPYLEFRSAILEGRVKTYYNSILQGELMDLLHDRDARKVDHPATGSKDLADAVCGAVFNALMHGKIDRTQTLSENQEVIQALVKDLARNKHSDLQDDSWLYND